MKNAVKFLSIIMALSFAAVAVTTASAKKSDDSKSGIRLTDKTYELMGDIISPSEAEKSDAFEDLTFGTIKGNVYQNDFFGLRLSVPAGYSFSKNGEIPKQEIEENYTVTVVDVNDTAGQNNINIHIGNVGSAKLTEKEYVDDGIGRLKANFENSNYTLVSTTTMERIVAGENHYILNTELSYKGIGIYQQVLIILKDGYNITFTATSSDPANPEMLLNCIEKIVTVQTQCHLL